MTNKTGLKIGGRRLRPEEYVGAVGQVMTENVLSVLDKIGIDVAKELEQNVPVGSGAMQSRIQLLGVKQSKSTYSIEIYLGVEYADYIDKGVKGVANNKAKTVPNAEGRTYKYKTYGMPQSGLDSLKNWAKSKNINLEGAAKAAGKRPNRKKLLKETDSAIKHLAYTIKRDGINARQFKKKSVDAVMPKYAKELSEVGYNSLVLKIKR
jgi:hypothetical protein